MKVGWSSRPAALNQAFQSMPGALLAKLVRGQGLFGLMDVFALDDGQLGLGDLRFEGDDGLRLAGGIGRARLREQGLDIGGVFLARLDHVLVVLQVVVAVGHAQPALQQVGHVLRGILEALGDEQAEQVLGVEVGRVDRVDVGTQLRAERRRELCLVLDRIDPGQGRFERLRGRPSRWPPRPYRPCSSRR